MSHRWCGRLYQNKFLYAYARRYLGPYNGATTEVRMYTRIMKILCYLFAILICSAAHAKPAWHTFNTVAGKRSESIGGYSKGCLLGADELEESGVGFETIRRHRKRIFYGHKRLTDFIRDYGRRIEAEGLPPVLIGDLSQIRGGRMNFGHRSHQIGLDADIWFSAPSKEEKIRQRLSIDGST